MPAVGYVYFVLGQRLGSFRTTRALGRAALEVADEVLTGCGDVWVYAIVTESLGLLSTWEGEFTEAADQLRRAVDAYQSLDDRMSATISVQALG